MKKREPPPETVELKWCPMCGWTLKDRCAESDGGPSVRYVIEQKTRTARS
jgi:hypothetical protein